MTEQNLSQPKPIEPIPALMQDQAAEVVDWSAAAVPGAETLPEQREANTEGHEDTIMHAGDIAIEHALGIESSLADDEDAAWLDEGTPEQTVEREDVSDMAAQLFNMGIDIPEGEEVHGVTKEDMDAWYGSLSPEAREYESSQRQANSVKDARISVLGERINEDMPGLLEGKLPPELEALIGPNYVLGANQSGDSTVEDAQKLLTEYGGVDMMDYNALSKRFLMFDKEHPDAAETAVTRGYYGTPDMGRYIIAVPVAENSPTPLEMVGAEDGPTDLKLEREDGHSSVNAKYVVGYVDGKGVVRRNANFMVSNEPLLTEPSPKTTEDWL